MTLATAKTKIKNKISGRKIIDALVIFVWGDGVNVNFFRRNFLLWVAVVGLALMYISFRYECKMQKETIDALTSELRSKRSESVRLGSEFHSGTVESVMQERIDRLKLNLTVQEQPAFVLKNTQATNPKP